MSPDEFAAVLRAAAGFGFGGVVAGLIAFLLLKSYLPSYLTEKAKNLATKEDIADITEKMEKVKEPFAAAIEDRRATHQLRVAALDRRLAAHQEAFALWRELVANVYSKEIQVTVLKCQDWWDKNCLYLEPDVREAFIRSYAAAHSHMTLVDTRPNLSLIEDHWRIVTQVGDMIFAAVELPALSAAERGVLEANEQQAT